MQFGYCTELLLQLLNVKGDVRQFRIEHLISYLESIGDSVVAFQTGSVVKLHVHTFEPYKVLEYCQKFGEFLLILLNFTHSMNNLAKMHSHVISPQRILYHSFTMP